MYSQEWFQLVNGQQPAAGAPFTHKVPGETWEKMLSVRLLLQSSGVAATRTVALSLLDGDGGVFQRILANSSQLAGALGDYTFADGLNVAGQSALGITSYPFKAVIMPPGSSWQLSVFGMDPGDQISAVRYYVERYPSAEWASSPGATPYMREHGV